MKQFIFLLILLKNISAFSESLPSTYIIVRSEEDKTLKKTEAVFVFTFYSFKGQIVKEEITFSYNTENKKKKPNVDGKIIEKVKPGKYSYQFFYNPQHIEITTDSIIIKPGYRTEIHVNFRPAQELMPVKKPVIYVYPIHTETISIELNVKGKLGFTYPEYKNGWNFIADKDGTININDKKYNYLFWDADLDINTAKLDLNEGFIVEKNDLPGFFETKLALMGLNSQEIQDYITYWCPLMNVNDNNYIHFIFTDEFSQYAPLTIKPKPDHLFRVCMLWCKAKKGQQANEQKIEGVKRKGFTVIEWGGTEAKDLILPGSL